MKNRVWALIQVGKYIGIDSMIAQIKPEEKEKLKTYLRRYFLNTHNVDQEQEMKAWEYQQEGTELGYKYLIALRDSLYK